MFMLFFWVYLLCFINIYAFKFISRDHRIAFHYISERKNNVITKPLILYDSNSKMPSFSEDEEEELKKLLSSYYDDYEVPDLGNQKPPSKNKKKKTSNKADSSKDVSDGNIDRPNRNWRNNNMKKSDLIPPSSIDYEFDEDINSSSDRSGSSSNAVDELQNSDNLEFDYDDFERAMKEADTSGMYSSGRMGTNSKNSRLVMQESGLKSGDMIPEIIWTALYTPSGENTKFSRVAKVADVMCFIADPRRMTDSFRMMLSQLNKVPKEKLNVETCAINCDDYNDHRKFLKKNSFSFPLFSDPSKEFMSQIKCTGQSRLSSAVFIIEVSSKKILKVLYEEDFDPFNLGDLVIDNIKEYRDNPKFYVESQIGIS